MADVAVRVEGPEEIAALLDPSRVGAISADKTELEDLVAWNLRGRAEDLIEWTERSSDQRDRSEVRQLASEIDALAAAYAGLVATTDDEGG